MKPTKHRLPSSRARQLSTGHPSDEIRQQMWKYMGLVLTGEGRANTRQIEAARHVRTVVESMGILASLSRCNALFFVSTDNDGNQSIFVDGAYGKAVLGLFENSSRETAKAIRRHDYDTHTLHPYFELFLEESENCLRSENEQGISHSLGYEELDREIESKNAGKGFFRNHPQIDQFCASLNELVRRVSNRAASEQIREEAKTFRRVASENRGRAMKFAAQLIKHAPAPRIAHLTFRKNLELYGNAVTHKEISEFRQELTQYLRKTVSRSSYLGYSIFLRQHRGLGYSLEAFIYLSESFLKPASRVIDELKEWWNGKVAPGFIGCVGSVLPHNDLTATTLEQLTLVTELDFYVRPSRPAEETKRWRQFWCSQFPADRLAPPARCRKRPSTTITKDAQSADPILASIDDELREQERLRKERRWQAHRETRDASRSASRKKGARTRAAHEERFAACKRRMMYDSEVIDVEAVEAIDTARAMRRGSPSRQSGKPAETIVPTHGGRDGNESQKPIDLHAEPDLHTASAASGFDEEQPTGQPTSSPLITPVLSVPGVTAPSNRAADAEGLIDTKRPDTPPEVRRETSEMQQRDAHGNLRTIKIEVRRKRITRPSKPK